MPNKAAKTGTALEAPMVVELLPQAWPWIVTGGKAFISEIAGMGIVTLVGELLESKGDEKEERVEPEGEAYEEEYENTHARRGEKKKKRKNDKNKDGDNSKANCDKVNESYLEDKGIDAHRLKRDILGKKTQIAHYDIYVDKNTGELIIFLKGGKGVGIPTGEFIK